MTKISYRYMAEALCVLAGVIFLFAPGAFAEDTNISNEDEINAALERAESEMKEQDDMILRARAHLEAADTAGESAAPQEPPAPVISEPVSPSAVPALSSEPPQDAKSLVRQASVAYRKEDRVEDAYELADEALRLDPSNRDARRLKSEIAKDLDVNMPTRSPYDETFHPPDGTLAYKKALEDNLLTVQEATEVALKNSVLLLSMEKRIRGAERKLTEAHRAFFPTAAAEASANGGKVGLTKYQGEYWKLNFSQTVYDGGEAIFTMRQARSGLESEKAKYAKERADIAHKTGEAYRGYIASSYNLSYQDALRGEVVPIRERIEKEHVEKLISEIDYLDVVSIANQVEFQHVSADSDYLSARLILAQEMGLEPEDPLPVDAKLEYKEIDVDLNEVRSLVQQNNWDIKIKELAARSAYFNSRVFESKKMPRVDLRGAAALLGEQEIGAGFHNDLEGEHSLIVQTTMPVGPNSVDYSYSRRKFGPTVLDLTGSDDWRHRVTFNLFDRLADITDTDVARAEYLQAKSELQKERASQDATAREVYYSYKEALIQVGTSLAKIKYREKQVDLLRLTTSMQDASISSLLSELVQLQEDRFGYVRAIADIHGAISSLNRLVGIDGYFGSES